MSVTGADELGALVSSIDSQARDLDDISIIRDVVAATIGKSPKDAAKILVEALERFHKVGKLDMAGNLLCELANVVKEQQSKEKKRIEKIRGFESITDPKPFDWIQWHLDVSEALSKIERYRNVVEAIGDAMDKGTLKRLNDRSTPYRFRRK